MEELTSAFQTTDTLPSVDTPETTLQLSNEQLDPNYNRNLELIKAGEDQVFEPSGIREYKPSKLETKQSSLEKKLQDKETAIKGPQNTRSDGLLNLLGSASRSTLGGLADFVVTGGAYANKAISDATGLDYYSEQDKKTASEFFDPYADQAKSDEAFNYDRSGYSADQRQAGLEVAQAFIDFQKGNYTEAFGNTVDAAGTALSRAPEAVTESLPFIASLLIGGEVKSVVQAGKFAYKAALDKGLPKAAAKLAAQDAKTVARSSLGTFKALANSGTKNTGLLLQSGVMTKDQNTEFAKNNDGQEMSSGQMVRSYALNTVLLGIERWTFKDIVGFKKNKALKPVWGKLDSTSKTEVAKKIAGIGLDSLKEGGQEYLQGWGEIINENWGTKDSENLADVLSTSNNVDAVTQALFGIGAGGLMSTPKSVLGAAGTANKIGKEKKLYSSAKETVDQGYKDSKTQNVHSQKLGENYQDSKEAFETLQTAEEKIAKINESSDTDLAKFGEIQKVMPKDTELSADTTLSNRVKKVGESEAKGMFNLLSKDPTLAQAVGEKDLKTISEMSNVQQVSMIAEIVNNAESQGMEVGKILSRAAAKYPSKIQDQVTALTKAGATNVTYSKTTNLLNRRGDVVKKTQQAVDTRKDPVDKSEMSFEEISKLKPKQQEVELSKLSEKGLRSYIRESAKAKRASRTVDREARQSKDASILTKAKLATVGSTETSSYKKGIKTANTLQKKRKTSEAKYNPKAPISERFKQQVKDVWEKVQAFADDKPTNDNLRRTVKDTVINLREAGVTEKEIPSLEKALEHLKNTKSISKTTYDTWKKKVEDYINENVSDETRTKVKSTIDDLKKTTKDKADEVSAKLDKLVKTNLNESEKVAIANSLTTLEKAGTITREKSLELLNKLLGDKPNENLKKKISEAYQGIAKSAKEAVSKEGREKGYNTAKTKAKEVLTSDLVSEVLADLITLSKNATEVANNTVKSTTKGLKELKHKVTSIDTLDVYHKIKGVQKDVEDGATATEVESIPDTDIDTRKGC